MNQTDKMDLDDEIEEATKLTPAEAFARVSKKLSELNDIAHANLQSIENLEFQLEQKREQYKKITEDDMPALMDEIGVSSVTLTNGQRIVIDTSLHCSIAAAAKEEAHKWLREHKHGDLIKNEVNIKFGMNEDNLVGEIKGKVEELGLKYDQKESVHPMSLKSFVKEQMKLGIQLPQDLFGIFIKRVVNLKSKG